MAMTTPQKPYDWSSYIEAAATRYGVPPALINSVIGVESGGKPGAVSRAGAGGLMQVMPRTYQGLAQQHGLGSDLMNPADNIMAGAAYMRQMYDQFGNWPDAMSAYNAGPGRMQQVKAGKATMPPETQAYVPKVMAGLTGNQGADMQFNRPGMTGADDNQMAAWSGMSGGLLDQGVLDNNWLNGMGGLLGQGQTASQPPGPGQPPGQPPGVNSRINDMIQELAAPRPPRMQEMTPGQYQLAGASQAMLPLAQTRDRQVGIGEMLGALGGGLTRGTIAADQAQQQHRSDEFGELTNLTKLQTYQRGEATSAAKIQAARQLAAQLKQSPDPRMQQLAAGLERDPTTIDEVMKAIAAQAYSTKQPKTVETAEGVFVLNDDGSLGSRVGSPVPKGSSSSAPKTVTLGNGPQGPGVYILNPDGTTGNRLGSSETGQDTEVTATLTPEEAQQQGLPAPPANSPYSNPNLSARGRSNLVGAQQKSWEKRAAANDEAVKSATALMSDMDRYKFLNEKVDREGWYKTGGASNTGVAGTVRGFFNDDIKEMQAITARITPTLRQSGSGATSDFDAKMFQEGTVGVGKTKQTNDNIATATIEGGKNLIAKTQFEQAYFTAYQHTAGMEAAWNRYLNANPIFDPKAPTGSYQLNQNRIDWQTFFKNGEKAPEPGRPQAPMSGASVPPPPPGAVIVGANPIRPPPPGAVTVPVQ